MLLSTQRSDCLCAHNAHLSVRRLGENIYGLYCSLFIIFNKFHWGNRKAGKFFPLGLCSFLCSTNPARDRESCFTRLTGCHANALVSLSFSGLQLQSPRSDTKTWVWLWIWAWGWLAVIWLSYLRSVSIKCGRRIVKHDVRYHDMCISMSKSCTASHRPETVLIILT